MERTIELTNNVHNTSYTVQLVPTTREGVYSIPRDTANAVGNALCPNFGVCCMYNFGAHNGALIIIDADDQQHFVRVKADGYAQRVAREAAMSLIAGGVRPQHALINTIAGKLRHACHIVDEDLVALLPECRQLSSLRALQAFQAGRDDSTLPCATGGGWPVGDEEVNADMEWRTAHNRLLIRAFDLPDKQIELFLYITVCTTSGAPVVSCWLTTDMFGTFVLTGWWLKNPELVADYRFQDIAWITPCPRLLELCEAVRDTGGSDAAVTALKWYTVPFDWSTV